mmetsp:Transcript_6405/g.9720  ORF Transcript_6405/g.9720 Transcript_6405/m.9720 type:complete len:203 (+) Transcript_6405:248-856(+)
MAHSSYFKITIYLSLIVVVSLYTIQTETRMARRLRTSAKVQQPHELAIADPDTDPSLGSVREPSIPMHLQQPEVSPQEYEYQPPLGPVDGLVAFEQPKSLAQPVGPLSGGSSKPLKQSNTMYLVLVPIGIFVGLAVFIIVYVTLRKPRKKNNFFYYQSQYDFDNPYCDPKKKLEAASLELKEANSLERASCEAASPLMTPPH